MQYLSCVYIQDREQNIEHQTSFQNTWYWIMASMQVAQTRWRLYTRKNTLPHSQYFGVQFGVCFSVVWGVLGYHVGRGYNFIYFHASFTALYVSNELHAHNLFSCIFLQFLTFNLWCMQNLQTPVFMVEESLFSAERGIKPFFGWKETHCTLSKWFSWNARFYQQSMYC